MDVDDGAQLYPSVRSRTHGAVLTGGKHSCFFALLVGQVIRCPACQLYLWMGRFIQLIYPVPSFSNNLIIAVDQDRSKGLITGCQGFFSQCEALFEQRKFRGRKFFCVVHYRIPCFVKVLDSRLFYDVENHLATSLALLALRMRSFVYFPLRAIFTPYLMSSMPWVV